jgi:hypothetical protein
MAIISGDPSKPGPYVIRVVFPQVGDFGEPRKLK